MWYKADAAPLSPNTTAGAAPTAAPSRKDNRTAGTTARFESTRRQNCRRMEWARENGRTPRTRARVSCGGM